MKNWKSSLIGIGMILSAAAAVASNPVGALTSKQTYEELVSGVAFVLMREQGQHNKDNGKL